MVFASSFPRTVRRTSAFPTSHWTQHLLSDAAATRQREGQTRTQAVTVEQDDRATTLRFDVPGVSREQLNIGIEGNVVRIESVAGAQRQYKMAYRLAQEIAAESSSAKLENGVLTLKLAKPAPVERSTRIAVH